MELRLQTITAWKEIALEKDAEHHVEQQGEWAWYAVSSRTNQPPPNRTSDRYAASCDMYNIPYRLSVPTCSPSVPWK
jgi:hypothetical protein